ncbi:rhodanese-like domain-containing protein [Halomonas salipaludis]|uniref:Sulfurtransferase n=1 Tax=Halomonas salipaludis TaxID=2032625 RepID=A0A2A2EYM5_9GAMM|nr:rhodanese-like domain-containing protein [Halomonas salipaludis]PAU77457.1 sulfurtransferase [Halomonas salipaludis]
MLAVTPQALKQCLATVGKEIALLDIREFGEYGMGHPFHAVNLPLSRLEIGIWRLVPRLSTPIVVIDEKDEGRARHAIQCLMHLGYCDVSWLEGGIVAWREAGHGVFSGVNVVSKAFGELVHERYHTPSIHAVTLADWQQRGRSVYVIDGRPIDEYRKMNIPNSTCCPNGELVKRLPSILDGDTATPVVINCAGRTRSIIGAQTLRWLGIENPVYALENGTQGWRLAGFELEHGSERNLPPQIRNESSFGVSARQLAEANGARAIEARTARSWLDDSHRTTYLFDVRSAEEYWKASAVGAIHAPGGQLIQATDQWVGVYRSRIVLIDDDECRAPVVAAWLALMGIEVAWLKGGKSEWTELASSYPPMQPFSAPSPPAITDIETALDPRTLTLDVRSAMEFRNGHLPGSRWINRALLECQLVDVDITHPVVLVGDAGRAACLAPDLTAKGFKKIGWLRDDIVSWKKSGVRLESSPDDPSDASCIDYLFFVHDRHDGNLEASRRYLAWELGLLAQLDADERASFLI